MLTSKERQLLEKKAAAKLELERRKLEKRQSEFTIYGIVDSDGKHLRSWQDSHDGMRQVSLELEPTILVPVKLEKLVTVNKDIKVVIGGRGSGKSVTINKILTCKAKDHTLKVLCLREFQNSLDDSTKSSLEDEIRELGFSSYNIQDKKISNENGSEFRFRGLARNVESIKSANSVKIAFTDEAETLSQHSITTLIPSIRAEGAELWFVANPRSAGDAFSKEFIIPYQSELDKHGYYEDEGMMVIVCNYTDNPFFTEKLERDRLRDFANKSRAEYDHIWLGKFNDSVENALIIAEWFDAAIDIHKNPKFKKLFEPTGAIIASHDPSDTGEDNKAYAMRHGSILFNVCEKDDGKLHDGARWAAQLAIADRCTTFTFDASGVGAGIREEIDRKFKGINIDVDEHKGGSSPDFPDDIYEGYDSNDRKNKQKNKDMFQNKRAQYMWRLRNRFYNSYRLVVLGEYVNPDDCISLDSESIEHLQALRSEICRQPLKNNSTGKIQIMDKIEMKKMGIASPNMLDAVAMTMIYPKANFKEQEEFFNQELPEEIDF